MISSSGPSESNQSNFPDSNEVSEPYQVGITGHFAPQAPAELQGVLHYPYPTSYSPIATNFYGQVIPLGTVNASPIQINHFQRPATLTHPTSLHQSDAAHTSVAGEMHNVCTGLNNDNPTNLKARSCTKSLHNETFLIASVGSPHSINHTKHSIYSDPANIASTCYSEATDSHSNAHKPHVHMSSADNSTSIRLRRKGTRKVNNNINYPMNYPAHPVPPEFEISEKLNNSWNISPPKPEDIKTRRYATGVDERNYFTVLEYEINNQSIIWDYYTGYVHLTGIWKALGNSKADIVRLLDCSPELETVIKRVRGGFLKIQGTWVPYEIARALAKNACYYLRFALIPLFGCDFPKQCTQPHEPGFGTLQLTSSSDTESKEPESTITSRSVQTSPTSNSLLPLKTSPSHIPTNVCATQQHKEYQNIHPKNHSKVNLSSKNYHRNSFDVSMNTENRSNHENRVKKRHSGCYSDNLLRPHTRTIASALLSAGNDYDEDVFEDEDEDSSQIALASPPLPRKVSFSDEESISNSPVEFLAMLKATRSLQQIKAGKLVKDVGGVFECAGRKFSWDGSDNLVVSSSLKYSEFSSKSCEETVESIRSTSIDKSVVIKPEPSPPLEPQHLKSSKHNTISLTNILNN